MVPECTTRPLSITLTLSPISCATRKFCSTSRMVAPRRFTSFRQSISAPMIAGASTLGGSYIRKTGAAPLGGLVEQQEAGGLDQRAREREHLFLSARERTGARQPEFLQRREEA